MNATATPASTTTTRRPAKPTAQAIRRRQQTAERRTTRKTHHQPRILQVVEHVAAAREVDWSALFAIDRGHPATASARVLAMGLCAALGIPQYLIARAFSRNWATVYSAELRCSALYRKSRTFRAEWDTLVNACGETGI